MSWNIVIAGGGFGGYYAARALEKTLPSQSARITLINDINYMLYTPLLPGVAGGTLPPFHPVVPLREALSVTDLKLGTVQGADPEHNLVHIASHEGRLQQLHYDHLIVALGSVSRALPVPGLIEYGRGFKTLSEAVSLRNRVVQMLETAEMLEDPKERALHLTFVFVGAGYAGLEGLAELQDYATQIIRHYPKCRLEGTRWIMVEAAERVMPEISPELAESAARELRRRGIEIRTDTTVEEVRERSVLLSDGSEVPTRNVVWTAGVKPTPAVEHLRLPLTEHGSIKVDRFMQAEGYDNVWAIGDAAAVPDPAKKGQQPSPPTAQHAIRQGKTVACNVAAVLGTGKKKPFTYKTLGVFVDMGRHQAVAQTLGKKWRGFPAWLLARSYHLSQMPGTKRKLRLMADWTIELVLGRIASELGDLGRLPSLDEATDPTDNGSQRGESSKLPVNGVPKKV